MRKLKHTLLLLTLGSFTLFLKAQTPQTQNAKNLKPVPATKYSPTDWLGMMRDQSVNVHDVQKAFYTWYNANHKKDKDKINEKSGEEDGAYEFFKRWEWYNLPRADAQGNRPDPFKVGSDYQIYLNTSPTHNMHRALSPFTPSSGSWTYAGNTTVPTNGGGDGRVNRVRIMPGNINTMFACAPSGGLWKTTNGGTSWATTTDQLGDLSTSDVAINPLKTNIMYLATGDADGLQSIYATPATIGVLKSYDGGATWVATGLSYSLSTAGANSYAISELLIDPADTSVLLAATSFGVWRSANSGKTWTEEQAGWFHSIEFEPSHPSIVYAGASSLYSGGGAFYRSTNNGINWSHITSGLPNATYVEGFEIAVTAADSNYVYILADSGNGSYGFEGLYRSTNDGVSFTTMSLFTHANVPNVLGWSCTGSDNTGQGWYTLSMAVSQTYADSLWVGGVNMWKSKDGGATWSLATDWTGGSCGGTPYVHADIHSIQFIPGGSKEYVVGCDGGVFKTTNAGTAWTNISNNLEIAQQYCIGSEAATAGKWITGWQDNGTNFSNAPWKQVAGGDGMDCFIDWSNNNNMYAETGGGGLEKSTNGGGSWSGCTSGITEAGPWVTPWVQDPKTAATLYSGFSNVWKSTNSAGSWTKISTWGGGGSITALAVDSANPSYIYAAQGNIIERTTNGGTTWTNITGILPVGSTSISGIALSSKTPSHVWVTMSGYSSGNQVFYSTNSGTTWTNISTGLPNLPVNCVVFESGSPNAVYVGTDQGVYYRDTVGNNWVFYNTGLPMVMIGDLIIYKPGKELIAATYGRGTWESPLYTVSAPVAGFQASATSICAGNSVTFTDTSINSPTTWNWTFAGGTPATATTQTVSVVYASSGNYTVTLKATNAVGSNTVTRTNYITVNANPAITASTTTNVACKGESTGVATANMATGGATPYTYAWAPSGGTNLVASNLSAGVYTMTVTDKNGCTATASITITQPATGINVATSVTTNLTCNGGNNAAVSTIPTGGATPYTYSWSGGGTNSSKSGLSGGTYSITVTDKNGCSASATVNVSEPAAMAIATYSVSADPGSCNGIAAATVTSGGTPPYTYLWSPGGATTDTITGQCKNTYCCLVTDKNGCTDSICVVIGQSSLGIANSNNADNINIYPDPNNGSFTVAGVIQGQVIEVYNDLGQQLSSTQVDKTTMYFDILNRADGIYLIRILDKEGSLITQKKIVKAQ